MATVKIYILKGAENPRLLKARIFSALDFFLPLQIADTGNQVKLKYRSARHHIPLANPYKVRRFGFLDFLFGR